MMADLRRMLLVLALLSIVLLIEWLQPLTFLPSRAPYSTIAVAIATLLMTALWQANTRARDGQPNTPEPILMRLLTDDDLALALVRCMTPRTAACCGLTCRTAADRIQQREFVRLCHEYDQFSRDDDPDIARRLANQQLESLKPGEPNFPDEGHTDAQLQSQHMHATAEGRHGEWTFQRIFLWSHTPVFRVVPFAQMSDQPNQRIDAQCAEVAKWLSIHPGLLVMITGHAQPNLNERLGAAIAQARAARVRQRLLFHLALDGHP